MRKFKKLCESLLNETESTSMWPGNKKDWSYVYFDLKSPGDSKKISKLQSKEYSNKDVGVDINGKSIEVEGDTDAVQSFMSDIDKLKIKYKITDEGSE